MIKWASRPDACGTQLALVMRTLRNRRTRFDPPIIGSSSAASRVRESILRFADATSNILITGESGTGKELIARNLHGFSERFDRPFVPVNCAALATGILESELFGHGKGAFTGAIAAHAGLFEQAGGGTLFLDEIGEVPPSIQAKLLRVLQDKEVRRMGTATTRRVDVRVISATNADIEKKIDDGTFRLDLFYRLNVLSIRVPSLRERVADIPELIDHFFALRGIPARRLDAEAAACLARHRWPGNIRELDNEIERVSVLYPRSGLVEAAMLSDRVQGRCSPELFDVSLLYEAPLPQAVGYLEENLLRKMLAKTNWNKSRSARELGLSRQGLLKKIKRYGIEPETPDPDGS